VFFGHNFSFFATFLFLKNFCDSLQIKIIFMIHNLWSLSNELHMHVSVFIGSFSVRNVDIAGYGVLGMAPHDNHQPAALELPHTAPNFQRQIYPPTDCFLIHICA
jgi:hypothetical protein